VQLRAHGEVVPAVVTVGAEGLVARLRTPARGVAAGQAIVAYRPDPAGDIVLGSATIASGTTSAPTADRRAPAEPSPAAANGVGSGPGA